MPMSTERLSRETETPNSSKFIKNTEDMVLDLQTKHSQLNEGQVQSFERSCQERRRKYFKCHIKIKFKVCNVFQFQVNDFVNTENNIV